MSICRYCGQNAGWFSEAHESCIQKANQGIEALKTCMANRSPRVSSMMKSKFNWTK